MLNRSVYCSIFLILLFQKFLKIGNCINATDQFWKVFECEDSHEESGNSRGRSREARFRT
jgi:hypothetical protein